LTVLMVTLILGLPIVAATLSVHATRGRIRATVPLYLLGVGAALVVLLVSTGLGVYLVGQGAQGARRRRSGRAPAVIE
jgi:hypothetical protein